MLKRKLNWGILSTAKIGLRHVIPAMKQSDIIKLAGIASRSKDKALAAAAEFGITRVYDDYEQLLADPDIDAVYNPLPNNLHVPYTIKALQAGKHVLCEKPIGMNADEAEQLIQAAQQYPNLKVMEAFMYRFHPQWQKVKELVDEGLLGEVVSIESHFSYFNADAANIRNQPETGGGGLMDIGCYCISFARYILEQEPLQVVAMTDFDPIMKTDRLTSGILNFGDGVSSSFTCSTQMIPYQRVNIFGTLGRIKVDIPVNAPADKSASIWLQKDGKNKEIKFKACNQYTLQCEAFTQAVLNNTPVPTPLTDALNNMKVIDALLKSATEERWVKL